MPWFSFNLQDFCVAFLSLLFEGVPFMFIGTLISGFVDAFVSPETMTRLIPRNSYLAIALCGVFGAVFPMCECGVVPVIRRMIRKGLPVSCALTYLLAAPIVNPVVALGTFAAFRGQTPATVTSLRLALGYAIACLCGIVVQALPVSKILNQAMQAPAASRRLALGARLGPPPAADSTLALDPLAAAPGFGTKLAAAVRSASFDFLDVGFYLVIGAAIASVFNTAVHRDFIAPLAAHPALAVVATMGLAFALSLCSTSDAFIAASFVGFPLAAKLAFMVFGPMMDFKLLFMYGLVFRKRFTGLFALALLVVVGALCVCAGMFFALPARP